MWFIPVYIVYQQSVESGLQLPVKHFALTYSKANKISCHTYFRQSCGQDSLFDKRPFDHQYILLWHTPKLLKPPWHTFFQTSKVMERTHISIKDLLTIFSLWVWTPLPKSGIKTQIYDINNPLNMYRYYYMIE